MDSAPAILRVGTWNSDNAKPGTQRGHRVSEALKAPKCDILCVTEGYERILPDGGHVRDAGPDWGYGIKKECRRVLIWSREPWSDVEVIGSPTLPSGRFVAGITQTPLGPLTIVGVCIPWANAHAGSGRDDRSKWQDHKIWLAGFEKVRYRYSRKRTVILGDFNQRIPRNPKHHWHDEESYRCLRRAFEGFLIPTAGDVAGVPSLLIDHIAHTPDMALVGNVGLWPNRIFPKKPLSDHFGAWGDFVLL